MGAGLGRRSRNCHDLPYHGHELRFSQSLSSWPLVIHELSTGRDPGSRLCQIVSQALTARHGVCFRGTKGVRVSQGLMWIVDKWRDVVDNFPALGKSLGIRRGGPGMTRGWSGEAGRGVRGLAQVCQRCHMSGWGDVDGLSTRCASEIWRGDAGLRGFPHYPQYYDKH
jgi:hypothetical protein